MDNSFPTLRNESDSLGTIRLNNDAYYGIHTKRAMENFKLSGKSVHLSLIYEIVTVKKACAMANNDTNALDSTIADAIIIACDLILTGSYDHQFRTDALQGGAGTSTNMNVNEVIANLALEHIGQPKGTYDVIHPLNHVNMSQSTNDVYPTALRIAAIKKIRHLADALAALQETLQQKEDLFSDILKLGRTQLMDALPVTLGQEFGAYARAISRDRWRIYKVEERLREIGIGATAVGTGLNAEVAYIYRVTEHLQSLTGLGLARSDLLIDTTQNMDVFVEVSGFLKSCATNLIKISNDIRLMASGPTGGLGEIKLEAHQAGSSIMPGKVNPVIPEMTIQAALKVIGNDAVITQSSYLGQLELNPFVPLIADSLLESLDLLIKSVSIFDAKCISTILADKERCLLNVEKSSALAAALIHSLGYDESARIAKEAISESLSIKDYIIKHQLMSEADVTSLLNVHQVTKPGVPKVDHDKR